MSDLDLGAVRGAVDVPGDAAYDDRRRAHQRAVDQRPAAVVDAESVADIRAVLEAARSAGATVAAQTGGHGASEDLAGSVLLRLTGAEFARIEVDEAAAVAVVGAGVSARAMLERLAGTGLVPPVGTSPDVHLVPLLLGGGHGWTARASGLSAQSVRRVELVHPDGRHGWVDDDTDPELMRELRGAGGLLGVVTAVEIDLWRATGLLGGGATYPVPEGGALWRAVRDAELPETTSVFVASMRIPDLPFLPEAIRGRDWFAVQAVVLDGDRAALDAVLAAGTAERAEIGPIDVAAIPAITNDPREAGAALAVSALLGSLPDEAIDAILDWHASETGAAAVSVGGRRLGGALDRPQRPSVAGTRGAAWIVNAILPFPEGADPSAVQRAADELMSVVRPWTVPGNVPTFLGQQERLADALPADAIELVHALRARPGGDVIRPTRLA